MPIIPLLPSAFHELFAGWVRIEPRCRSDDFAAGLEARTADPLWFLGRQWQFGEFAGEDAASPASVEVAHQSVRLNEVEVQADGVATRVSLTRPLELLVEQEAVETLARNDELTWDWRLRVRVGQQFERYCRWHLDENADAVVQLYRTQLGIEATPEEERLATDRASQRFRQLLAGRVVDGWRLRTARASNTLPATTADLTPVFSSLDAWWLRLFGQPGADAPAWRPSRLDYEFRSAAPITSNNEVVVSTPSYRNGDFDWHSCVLTSEGNWDGASDAAPQRYPPTRATFPGMPHPRWWAFEDARTDFGALDVSAADVGKLALMEFALIYGDDWFMIPLGVPLGSLTRIRVLQVTNVFGEPPVDIPPARTAGESALLRWEMYQLARAAGVNGGEGPGLLFVPPVVGFREESEPIEEVRFLRDEGANMVWGVEHRVPNGLGTPVDGFEAQLERRARERELANEDEAAAAAPPTGLVYRLATTVPANWIPFLPANALTMLGTAFRPGITSVRLCRAQMLRNEAATSPEPIPSMTRLLDPTRANALLWIDEEAVPREGVKVQLTKQRVRWTNGETYVWLGKKVLVGRGEGRSGLRFDVVRG